MFMHECRAGCLLGLDSLLFASIQAIFGECHGMTRHRPGLSIRVRVKECHGMTRSSGSRAVPCTSLQVGDSMSGVCHPGKGELVSGEAFEHCPAVDAS